MLRDAGQKGAAVLTVEGMCKRFGSLVALDDVSFEVERGQVVGFLGPNGAGKTTAMRAIMKLISLDGGSVRWDGAPVTPETRQTFGYMPAERGMYQRMKVRDHLVYYARLGGLNASVASARADEWLDRLGLGDRGNDIVQNLSSGNQQRVQLALALLNDPDLLVLDEPYSGLDPIAVDTLNDVVRDQVDRGSAMLLSSHQLDLVADVCSAVVIVDRGRVILHGDVAALRAASPTRYLDLEFATPTSWVPSVGVLKSDGSTIAPRLNFCVVVDTAAEADRLISEARAAGDLLSYAFAPPGLTEVFVDTVGRDHAKSQTASST